MQKQRIIKKLGFFLLLFSIIYMVFSFIKDTGDDTMYIVYGLLMTSVGLVLSTYGDKRKKETE